MPQLALTVVLCVTCLLAAYGAAKFLHYDMGMAAVVCSPAHSRNPPSLELRATRLGDLVSRLRTRQP